MYLPWAFFPRSLTTKPRSSTPSEAAFAPAPWSSWAKFFPAITRWKMPTLKKSIHFSWALISLRTVEDACGLQVVQSTLSQVRFVMLL